MYSEWAKFKLWKDISSGEFAENGWQDRNAITRPAQLKGALDGVVSPHILTEIEAGLSRSAMSIRLNPYMLSLIDWANAETDPIRRQFLPMRCEQEDDHPCLELDSLAERQHSPVAGLVHRYPDKVLFLVTSVCPVYCQYCTRSYAVGQDTQLIQKDHVTSVQNWTPALDYIRAHPQIEDIVVSGGDLGRLKPAHVRLLGNALLDIEHVRRIRLATKVLAVQPMKVLTDQEWLAAVLEIVARGRSMFKDVCLHTHFNHPNEITPAVQAAMRRLHGEGVFVRNQTVLLRGVNDDACTLRSLIKRLGRIHIHPYYVYLCDMVKATEHFRLPLKHAQRLEKEVRGATAGFNTPLFIVDTPSGKRDVHSAEFHDSEYGVSGFISPAVTGAQMRYYFDPLRSLSDAAAETWVMPGARESILGYIAEKAQCSAVSFLVNGGRAMALRQRGQRSPALNVRRPAAPKVRRAHGGHCNEPLRPRVIVTATGAEAHGG
jgi:lysine 2,3-aminomutase